MSWRTSIFNWFRGEDQTGNPTKQQPRRPSTRDWTDELQANATLTRQLYHNSYPGMKLAGGMAFTPIAVPIWFMGLPTPKSENETIQEIIKKTLEEKSREMSQIHLQCHREGTIWIYPFWSSISNEVIWEFIPDDVVTDIVRDINSGKIIQVITDEEITLTIGYDKNVTVRRRRTFSKKKVDIQWINTASGQLPARLVDKSQRNVSGLLPIPFSNNNDGDEIRGHSDYERILSDLKNYHDIDLAWSNMLAKFKAKQVQTVSDAKQWLANQGADSIADIDLANTDLILNLPNEETIFVFPEKAHQSYKEKLEMTFKKIVEGSATPEILWGTRVTGNHATSEEQMDTLVKFIEDKRAQKNKPYRLLFDATIRLELIATIQPLQEIPLIMEWNALDAVSQKTKSDIFLNFAKGVNSLILSAGITKTQLYDLWKYTYPFATDEDFETFRDGLAEMALHKSFQNASYEVATDFSSGEILNDND